MKLVAGLGNPGPKYADSRHNVGFMVVDELARRWKADVSRFDRDFEGLIGETQRGAERVLLLKPATYMNLSGRSIGAAARYYKLTPVDVLVVMDDMDLPLGRLRIRASGSAGGQKGLDDVVRNLGTAEIPRVRIGIGKVHKAASVAHVLGSFSPDEREIAVEAVGKAADAVECWLSRGIAAAMNEYNRNVGDAP